MKPIHILLIEDNEGDILLTTEALAEGKIINEVSVARDGEEAIEFLNKSGQFANVTVPDLILLDVNLPKKNGHEVLEYIKSTDHLKHIPVIILTTSSSHKDILNAYRNFANAYITKPVDIDDFIKVLTTVEDFWIGIVQLPK